MRLKNTLPALLFVLAIVVAPLLLFAQSVPAKPASGKVINWLTFEEALQLNKKKPRMIFIDIYTDWCGWCKKMDTETFSDGDIASYVNKKYYAVKLNAEQSGTITFKEQQFVNPNPGKSRSTHQLAMALLKNERLYPSYVILDKASDWTFKLKGYKTPAELMPILEYYGDGDYWKMSWGEFQQNKK